MTHKQGHDPQGSFMDSIPVKIAEQYKPPPRINLPVTYSQRLSLNKQIQDNMPDYSFMLEKKVKEQLEALRAARNGLSEESAKRIANVKNERKRREEQRKKTEELKETNKLVNNTGTNSLMIATSTSSYASESVTMTPCSKILTPIPLTVSGNENCKPVDKSPFNISDFEADTSSPFDNMELKTINDMEELAQVLKREESANNTHMYPTYSAVQSNYISYPQYNTYHVPSKSSSYSHATAHTNDYIYDNDSVSMSSSYAVYPFVNQNNESVKVFAEEENVRSYNRVPEIMRALEAELDNYHISNAYINHSPNCIQQNTSEDVRIQRKNVADDLENPFNALPEDVQELAKRISSMGFPLPRVARACNLLGKDNKKVVEYLLAMSELMDLGFSEKEVSNALIQCNNDRDKALDSLIL